MHSYVPSAETLHELYRFALLLTAAPETAERAVMDSLTGAAGPLAQLRCAHGRNRWLAAEVRRRCLASETAGINNDIATSRVESRHDIPDVSQQFASLPEPQRTALALFYVNLFDAEEIAQFLHLNLDQLAALLAAGRTELQRRRADGSAAGAVAPTRRV